MTSTAFLSVSKAFLNGQGGNFAILLTKGLPLTGLSEHELAREVEVIPSMVSRWIAGTATPMPGVQQVVINKLRARILNNKHTK